MAAVVPPESNRFLSLDRFREERHRLLRQCGEKLIKLHARREYVLAELDKNKHRRKKLEGELEAVDAEIDSVEASENNAIGEAG